MSKKRKQAPDNGAETAEAPDTSAETPDNGAETAEASAKQPAAPPAAAAVPSFGDLDQVRQILFGAESQEIDTRLVGLEKHFTEVIDALRNNVDKQFKAMAASVKKQNDALNKRLDDENAQRAQADAGLSQDIQNLAKALQENRAQLDQHLAETEQALRAALQDEADKASKDRAARFDELLARLEQTAADLGDAKTDRHSLADLLDQLSAGLRNGR